MKKENRTLPSQELSAILSGDGREIDPLAAREILVSETSPGPDDSRIEPRHFVERSLTVLPVTPDGIPDGRARFDARTYDVSSGGFGIEIGSQTGWLPMPSVNQSRRVIV